MAGKTMRWMPVLLGLVLAGGARAELVWQPAGGDSPRHGGYVLKGATDAETRLLTADLGSRELTPEDGLFRPPRTGQNNYHALVASQQREGRTETAIRYVFRHGRPTGHSPSELTGLEKTRLEIVPDPLPREHQRYRAGEEAAFLVRFDGRPLAGQAIILTTSHGTAMEAVTDRRGRAVFTLPDDFETTRPGRRANRPAELVLTAETEGHVTTLSAAYHVDPGHWQRTAPGLGVALVGMVAGVAGWGGVRRLARPDRRQRHRGRK